MPWPLCFRFIIEREIQLLSGCIHRAETARLILIGQSRGMFVNPVQLCKLMLFNDMLHVIFQGRIRFRADPVRPVFLQHQLPVFPAQTVAVPAALPHGVVVIYIEGRRKESQIIGRNLLRRIRIAVIHSSAARHMIIIHV